MRTRVLYLLIAILVLLGAGFYLYNKYQQAPPPVMNDSSIKAEPKIDVNAPANSAEPAAGQAAAGDTKKPVSQDAAHFSGESDVQGSGPVVEGNDIQVQEVDYDGITFAPASLTINVNDYVFFKNNSNTNFWPQSSAYAAFNAGHPIAPGKDFQFQFTKVGSWAYVDHLKPEAKGTIVVKKR